MNINWKVFAPLGIIIIVAALLLIGYSQFVGMEAQQDTAKKIPPQEQPITEKKQPIVAAPPATGNVDDAVDAILTEIVDDQALFADTEKDAELITADSQTISDFGQSYNENEF